MAHLAKRIDDKRMLRLIRAFLNAGVMETLLHEPVEDTGDAQLAHPSSSQLWYLDPPYWLRPIGAFQKLLAQLRFVTPEVLGQLIDRHAVYSGRALVLSDLLQRFP